MNSSERGAGMKKRIWFLIPIVIIIVASPALILRKDGEKNEDYEIIEEDIINFDEEVGDESDLPEVVPEKTEGLHTEEVEEDDGNHTNGEDVELPILPLS